MTRLAGHDPDPPDDLDKWQAVMGDEPFPERPMMLVCDTCRATSPDGKRWSRAACCSEAEGFHRWTEFIPRPPTEQETRDG